MMSNTLNRLLHNPVLVKEMRSRMRGSRAHIIISVYLLLMSLQISLVYLVFTVSTDASVTVEINQVAGKIIFGLVVGFEVLMVCFLAPALTASAISAERERQTYDLIRTTLLTARSLVLGKLTSALSFLLLLLVVGLPLMSLAFLFGGVAIEEVFIAFLLLIITTLNFCATGVLISSLMKSTLASTVISYIVSLLMVFGIWIFLFTILTFFSILGSNTSLQYNDWQVVFLQILLLSIGYLLVSLNPLSTIIASEVMFINQQSVFYTTIPLSNGWNFPIIAPWVFYSVFYLIFSLLLIWLSIRAVHRVER